MYPFYFLFVGFVGKLQEASVAAADKSRSINVLSFYVSRQQERFKLTPLATSKWLVLCFCYLLIAVKDLYALG